MIEDYVISFLAFGIYLIVDTKLQLAQTDLRWFHYLCLIIGIFGLILINIFDKRAFEYFYLLITIFSIIEIYKEKKHRKQE